MPSARWQIPSFDVPPAAARAGLSPLAWRLLAARDWLDAGGAVRAGWDGQGEAFGPAMELPDMGQAAERVIRAVQTGERMVVHGDYDADGISGTALLCGGLRALGATVEPFVPDRIKDGYGVASRLVEHCGQAGVGLLITVDTGSSAHAALGRAAELGIDTIVCDHHLLESEPAPCFALINPQREDSRYPHRDLCGCAIAYKLLEAVHAGLGLDAPTTQLDLVALATVADQVPLRGENRMFVRGGLEELQRNPRPGLAALLERCRLRGVDFDEGDLAFQIAPRINAAGRVERPRTALELLLSRDAAEAGRLAARCDDLNRQRRSLQKRVSASARLKAERLLRSSNPRGLVLADSSWHFGVVGIAAAQIATEFELPTVLLAIDGEVARGSARSACGVNLKLALDGCSDLLLRHGGHAAAAGLAMPSGHIEALRERFARVVSGMPQESKAPGPRIDASARLEEIDLELVDFLRRLGPFGTENPRPRLVSTALRVESWRPVGGDHLKLRLREDENGPSREFIGFSKLDRWQRESSGAERVDVIYSVGYREGTPFDPWQLQLHGFRTAVAGTSG